LQLVRTRNVVCPEDSLERLHQELPQLIELAKAAIDVGVQRAAQKGCVKTYPNTMSFEVMDSEQ
jgi:hypothetical protein